jgi:hypothetical protein
VRPACRVGAVESGTLLYFRDNTLNLDGKANPAALRARVDGTLGRYVDRAGVDVLIDFPRALRVGMGPRPSAWREPRRAVEPFMVAVRRGRERCLR